MEYTRVFILLTAYVSAKDTDLKVFRGKFEGDCNGDGLYYMDEHSFIMCNSKNFYIQPCPPGTMNQPYDGFDSGSKYGFENFCDINLVNFGYTEQRIKQGNAELENRSDSYEQHDREREESEVYDKHAQPEVYDEGSEEHEDAVRNSARERYDSGEDVYNMKDLRDRYEAKRDQYDAPKDAEYSKEHIEEHQIPKYEDREHGHKYRERMDHQKLKPFHREDYRRPENEIRYREKELERDRKRIPLPLPDKPDYRPQENEEVYEKSEVYRPHDRSRPDSREREYHREEPVRRDQVRNKHPRFPSKDGLPMEIKPEFRGPRIYPPREEYDRSPPRLNEIEVYNEDRGQNNPPYDERKERMFRPDRYPKEEPRRMRERDQYPTPRPYRHGPAVHNMLPPEYERLPGRPRPPPPPGPRPFLPPPYTSPGPSSRYDEHPRDFSRLPREDRKEEGYIYMVISMPKRMVTEKDRDFGRSDLEDGVKIIGYHNKDGRYTPLDKAL